jgi:hypothetical protein
MLAANGKYPHARASPAGDLIDRFHRYVSVQYK